MSLKFGFFNSIEQDRTYSAEDMVEPYRGLLTDGIIPDQNDLSLAQSEQLKVTALDTPEMKVNVKTGRGIFDGKWLNNTTIYEVEIENNTGSTARIDSIVIQVDSNAREIKIVSKQGSTVPPAINTNPAIKEYRLANITVAPNATEIVTSNIADTRASDDCGFCRAKFSTNVKYGTTDLEDGVSELETGTLYCVYEE